MSWWEYIEFPVWVNAYIYHRVSDRFGAGKSSPGNVTGIPRTDEGAPLPLLYGRCRVNAPVLAWIGNWFHRDSDGYFVDMLFVVGIPFYKGLATLNQIFAGDIGLNPQGPKTYGHSLTTTETNGGFIGSYIFLNPGLAPGVSFYDSFSADEIFNEDDGIKANIEFFAGHRAQNTSDYINDVSPESLTYLQFRQALDKFTSIFDDPSLIPETLMPGYRNQVMCFMEFGLGKTPNFSSYSFEVRALSTGSSADLGQSLEEDADPAAVILDLLTSPWGKLGIPVSKIDLPSFQAASLTLYNEEHGYSRALEEPTDASEIIGEILRQIDGILYEEPTTGTLVLKLVRADYDLNDLDDINPDNAEAPEPGWYSVRGWSETFNQVRVTWTDRQNNYADGLRIAQNAANATGQTSRALRSVDIHFPGCCTEELARKLAARELAVVSRPMVRATIVVNRSFYATRPGDVVTLTWPELGIDHMVMRVARVDLGQLHDGRIRLDLLRDVFDVTVGAF